MRHGPDAREPVTETITRHMPAHVLAAFRWLALHGGDEWRGAGQQDEHHDLADRLTAAIAYEAAARAADADDDDDGDRDRDG